MRFTKILLFLLLISFQGLSQWTPTSGPEGGRVFSIMAGGNRYYAGTGNGIWISEDAGTLWKQAAGGISSCKVHALVASGPTLWAGTADSGAYRSADSGITWVQINNGLTNHIVRAL